MFWLPPLVGHGFVHRVCTFGVLRISFRLRRKNKKKNPPSEEPQKTKNNGWCTFTVPCVDARVQYISRRCTVDRTPSLNLRCSASYGRIPNLRFFNILFFMLDVFTRSGECCTTICPNASCAHTAATLPGKSALRSALSCYPLSLTVFLHCRK